MPKQHPESQLQQTCVRWFRLQYPQYLIFAIPNGGRRSKIEAAIMQGEGVTPGIPDLCIVGTRGQVFFIEMKYGAGKLTDHQQKIHDRLMASGIIVYTCRTLSSFMSAVNQQLHQKKTA